jgi:predicted DCC family thiol-disulfide oxidoreductase YuxK
MQGVSGDAAGDVWFVYDGACPICTMASQHWRLRETVGTLHLLNAREAAGHPLMKAIKDRGIDLDQGMVIAFQDSLYHGADALHVMALLGTRSSWFNRLNAFMFRSKTLSRLCYPAMRGARRLALALKGETLIYNLKD